MTKLLDKAIAAVNRLEPELQDEIARAIMLLAGEPAPSPYQMDDAERAAIARSKEAAARGEFASDEDVRAVWAKYWL